MVRGTARAASAALAAVLVPAAGAGAASPNLVVTSVAAAQRSVVPGRPLTIKDTTRNASVRRAPASSTRFYLSTDGKLGKGDIHLGNRHLPALAAHRLGVEHLKVRELLGG